LWLQVLGAGGPSFADPLIAGEGWQYSIQVPLWGAKAKQLLPSFTAPFGSKHPNVTVSSAVALRSGVPTTGTFSGEYIVLCNLKSINLLLLLGLFMTY